MHTNLMYVSFMLQDKYYQKMIRANLSLEQMREQVNFVMQMLSFLIVILSQLPCLLARPWSMYVSFSCDCPVVCPRPRLHQV